MKTRLIIFSLALAPWLLRGAPVTTNVIDVGVSAQEPFIYIRAEGTVVEGFLPDILNQVAAQNGWTIRYVADTPANNAAKLEQGMLDLTMPAPWPSDRFGRQEVTGEGLAASCGQLYTVRSLLARSLSDLTGKTIAVRRGDPHYARFSAMLAEARIRCEFIEMDSYTRILESIDRRLVDAGLVDRFFGNRASTDYSVTASPIFSPMIEFRIAAPRNRSGRLIEIINHAQSVLKADRKSLYHQSLRYWTRDDEWPLPAILSGVLMVVALATAGLFALNRLRHMVDARAVRLNTANLELRRTCDTLDQRTKGAESETAWCCSLLNSTEDAILVHGLDARNHPTKFIEANLTACHRLGYTRGELLSLTPRDIEVMSDSGSQQPYAVLLKNWGVPPAPAGQAAGGDQPLSPSVFTERTYRTKSGKEIPMEVTVRLLEHDGHPTVFCCAHDITSRRKTQFALKESERRFHDFFARSPIGIAIYDIGRQLTDINSSALGMFGVSDRSHFLAPTLSELPEMSEEAELMLLKGGTFRYEAVMDFDAAAQSGLSHSTRSGKSHFDILIANLGLDWDFIPKGFLVMIQDITEHRRAEEALRQNERLLRQAHKMEAIGTLAGGIAHDFNNILTPIIGYTEMALFTCTAEDSNRRNLEEVLKASHRAKDLVRQILAFSRQTEGEERPLRLAAVIEEVMTLLRGSVRPDIQLHAAIKTDRDMVRADPTQLHQVLMNLGTNALHAMRRTGGILEYGLNQVVLDGRTKGPLSRLRRGDYVEMTVRDTGIGIERATLEHIFEPFFTTKKSGEGTGMGLAVAHGIVTSLNGAITVESEVGKGSIFHVVIPLIEQAGRPAPGLIVPVPRGTERVLFVDDEKDIVNMVGQMLKTLGYTPVTCLRTQDALTLLREAPDRFDILITDQVMPGMTGMELVREAHHLRPALPVLLCTGFSKTLSDEDLLEGGVQEVLMKPIVLRQLAEAIRRVLTHKPRESKPA